MRTNDEMKMLYSMVFLVLLYALQPVSYPFEPPDAQTIVVKLGAKWISFKDLNAKAVDHIRTKDPTFDLVKMKSSIWIDPESSEKRVLINYFEAGNKPAWNIYFSKDGQISGGFSGKAREVR